MTAVASRFVRREFDPPCTCRVTYTEPDQWGHTMHVQVRSSCAVHFLRYPPLSRLRIMIRELTT